jgi:dihydrofolate reductase
MRIRTRLCTSADGCVSTPDGWPAQLADPAWDPQSFGMVEPALTAPRWPWSDLDVFVLGSHRPAGTPDDVVVESTPSLLLEKVRAANRGGDVHLVGGPRTVETFRALGALDELGLIVLPLLLGDGVYDVST